ncbi:hypothetical protein AVEN_111009-1 [Araneus ventricosus]|uniref:Uncharacterized protein n=1 Tax=Araneus ventricosus TaxID=182803 RepID=A0A4Y2HNY4_ARAVE|nr:hypothetical protein AVEN_111009-1 [Araneus ventricosus]
MKIAEGPAENIRNVSGSLVIFSDGTPKGVISISHLQMAPKHPSFSSQLVSCTMRGWKHQAWWFSVGVGTFCGIYGSLRHLNIFRWVSQALSSKCAGWVDTALPVVTKVLAAVRTLDRFGISDRAGAAIVSAALQGVGIISENNVLNVVDRNKIRRERTKARTTLLSQVIKDYDHDQFGLYFDGRKDRTLSMEDNRRKVIIEEHISLVKEPGSEYIGHVSVNFGRA